MAAERPNCHVVVVAVLYFSSLKCTLNLCGQLLAWTLLTLVVLLRVKFHGFHSKPLHHDVVWVWKRNDDISGKYAWLPYISVEVDHLQTSLPLIRPSVFHAIFFGSYPTTVEDKCFWKCCTHHEQVFLSASDTSRLILWKEMARRCRADTLFIYLLLQQNTQYE